MTAPTSAAGGPTTEIRIDHDSAVHAAATAARERARQHGLSGAVPDQAAVLASELASNLAKHAVGGVLYVQPLPLGDGLEILAVDRGPGIPELERCLTDGYTTAGTLGAGLGAVRRIATEFTIRSRAGAGTLVCARLTSADPVRAARRDAGAVPLRDVGAVSLPVPGERDCGDAGAVVDTGGALTGIVVDALGHGPAAAEVARTALRSFHRAPDRPLAEFPTALNRALRHTRGAVVAAVRLHPGAGGAAGGHGARLEYCGVGNIRTVVLAEGDVRHRLTGQPGIVGWNLPSPRVRSLRLPPGSTVALHSDGIDSRWSHAPPAFLLSLPAPLLAAALAHGHRLLRDDATVLTARTV